MALCYVNKIPWLMLVFLTACGLREILKILFLFIINDFPK